MRLGAVTELACARAPLRLRTAAVTPARAAKQEKAHEVSVGYSSDVSMASRVCERAKECWGLTA
eukprot:1671145-Pleurochrysis_carterae.AAC.1